MGYTFSGTAVSLGGGRGWLEASAAYSLFRLDARIGRLWDINEAGRTYAQQAEFYATYQRVGYPIALSPDAPSIHQKGQAIDTDDQIVWLLNENGWFQTVYRNGSLVEPWHFEYDYSRDQHRNEPASGGSEAFPEEDMTPEQDGLLRNIAAHLFAGGTDAARADYLGAPGTVYSLLKTPVDRPTGKVPQIQDNADTKTISMRTEAKVDKLLAAPASGGITEAQIDALADKIAVKVIAQLPEGEAVEVDIAAVVRAELAKLVLVSADAEVATPPKA